MLFTKVNFITIDVIVAVLFIICIYRGWKMGAWRRLLNLFSSLFKIAAAGFGAYHLEKLFNPVSEEMISGTLLKLLNIYMEHYGLAPESKVPGISARITVFMLGFLMYFILLMIVLSLIGRLFKKKPSREERIEKKVSKNIGYFDADDYEYHSLFNRLLGAVMGFILFLVCTIMPCPMLVTWEDAGIFINGKDVVHKTLLAIPYDYIAKPVVKKLKGEEFTEEFWEHGLFVFEEDFEQLGEWWKEHGITGWED